MTLLIDGHLAVSHVGSRICRPVRRPDRLQMQARRRDRMIRGPAKWKGK